MRGITKRLTTSFMLRFNIAICAVLMLIFGATTLWLGERVSSEQRARSERTLSAFEDQFTSEVHQMFGRYQGTLVTDEGETIQIRDLIGFAEEHHARW